MGKLYLSVFFVFIGVISFAQERSIYGNVSDPATQKGIGDLSILNNRSGMLVATDKKGDFYMRAQVGDSLIINSLGYNRKGIKWNGVSKNVNIYAKQEAIMLQELVVTEKSTAELNKEINAFLANPQDGKAIKNEILRRTINTNTSQPGLGISIDALYDMFSKEGKEKRKVADLQTADILKFYAELKYNKNVVRQITKLDEETLDLFMLMCSPGQQFILKATDYDLTKKILDCLHEFNIRQINGTINELRKP